MEIGSCRPPSRYPSLAKFGGVGRVEIRDVNTILSFGHHGMVRARLVLCVCGGGDGDGDGDADGRARRGPRPRRGGLMLM